MKNIKKILGLVWVVLAPIIFYFIVTIAIDKIGASPAGSARTNALLQWLIILIVFIPICIGMIIFGVYALKGEYDKP